MGIQINGSNDTIQADDGSLSLAGSVSYEDVTNVTSVGLSTFSSGIHIDDSITHLGDTDTKIRFPAADTVTVETGGNERVRIDSSGRMGLGTNSPAEKLHVNATGTAAGDGAIVARFYDTAQSKGLFLGYDSNEVGGTIYGANLLTFQTYNGSSWGERMRLDGSGRMGLGTSSPSYKLQVSGTGTISSRTIATDAGGDAAFFVQNDNSSIAGPLTYGTTKAAYGALGSNETAFYSNRSTTILADGGSSIIKFAAGGNTERMRIDNSGRLLVGTTTPGLVHGDELTLAGSGNSGLTIRSGSTTSGSIYFSDGTAEIDQYKGLIQYTHSGDYMRFLTANTERLRIDSSGVVTIGTTAAGSNAKFEVASTTGSISSATARINGGGTTTGAINTGASILFAGHDGINGRDFASLFAGKENGTSGNHAAYLAFATRVNSGSLTERMRIDSSGRLLVGKTSHSGDALFVVESNHASGGIIAEFDNNDTGNFGGLRILGGVSDRECRFQSLYGNSYLTFYTEGTGSATERLRIDSSGRLLVGTTSSLPADSQLQVEGTGYYEGSASLRRNSNDVGGTALRICKSRGTSNGSFTPVISGDTIGIVQFCGADGNSDETGAEVRGVVDGSVGNGNMPGRLIFSTNSGAQNASPTERMRINSSGSTKFTPSSSSATLQIEQGTVNTDSIRLQSGGTTNTYLEYRGYLGHAWFVDTNERMRIDSSGRLLVGVTQSFASANADNLQVGNNSAAVESGITLGSTIGSGIRFADAGNASAGIIEYVHADDSMRFFTDTTMHMSITSGGVMKMGDPSSSGSGGVSLFTSDSGSSHQRGRQLMYAKSTTSASQEIFQIFLGSTNKLLMRADGNLYNAAGGIGTLSDAKLKENIVDATSQWNDIKSLRIRKYNFKEETGHDTHTQIGLVAQEVELISPGLVYDQPDKDENGNDLGTVTKVVNTSVFYMKTAKALQEAMARIETLEAKVAALEG